MGGYIPFPLWQYPSIKANMGGVKLLVRAFSNSNHDGDVRLCGSPLHYWGIKNKPYTPRPNSISRLDPSDYLQCDTHRRLYTLVVFVFILGREGGKEGGRDCRLLTWKNPVGGCVPRSEKQINHSHGKKFIQIESCSLVAASPRSWRLFVSLSEGDPRRATANWLLPAECSLANVRAITKGGHEY